MKGEVCIFANTPIWEPKKIRYRYPGEAWQEIAGESYLIDLLPILGGDYPTTWLVKLGDLIVDFSLRVFSFYDCSGNSSVVHTKYVNTWPAQFVGTVLSIRWMFGEAGGPGGGSVFDCGNGLFGVPPTIWISIIYKDTNNNIREAGISDYAAIIKPPGNIRSWKMISRSFKIHFTDITRPDDPPKYQCQFTVFDVFNQVISNIIRDDCPEVIVVPERCYYKAENERLVAKIFQSFLDPPLRIEYQGNCATVWKDSWPLSYFPLMIYKECTDNPNCPPPRIRLDNKKCKEECRQCPPGTAIKVLLGGNIACVDAFGCIIKEIKFKPGCNSYDCICG
ncbi:hypothetical protein IQ224_13150 [Microcystis sp. LEGE 00066]|uniref:hypothetical protein n=1 Tax=Microcystis sp. LEGE 00066 TaxID=1828685 RepID=UPI00187E31F9|nr:hypothetical protein [Microcystis sp. LEGE 00066]MBE9263084.1 hypothetical protein [Microcystis sp. LEGE 00066]